MILHYICFPLVGIAYRYTLIGFLRLKLTDAFVLLGPLFMLSCSWVHLSTLEFIAVVIIITNWRVMGLFLIKLSDISPPHRHTRLPTRMDDYSKDKQENNAFLKPNLHDDL